MGKGSTGTEDKGQKYNNLTALIALDQYRKKAPIMDELVARSTDFMKTGDIGQSAYFDPMKNAVSDQLAVAKNSALENMPVGGAMFEELNDQFIQGGQSMIDNVLMKELDNALTIGMGGDALAIQGLGTAGGNTASLAGAKAQRATAEGNNSNMIMGGGMCIIFTATYGEPPDVSIRYRDEHTTVSERRGYYWFADRVVPIMNKYPIFRRMMKVVMTGPMTSYGKYFYGYNKIGVIFKPLTKAWLKFFDLLGKRPPYRRRGALEVV